ncbi:MAG: hypothetical protein IPM94_13105 [bacterium]|nr:hypothetical protein [bacterium]
MAPLFACAIAGHSSTLLAFASTLNAFFACGDMFGVGLLLSQVPTGATVRNQGGRHSGRHMTPKPPERGAARAGGARFTQGMRPGLPLRLRRMAPRRHRDRLA